jgi:hypothetical protein
MNIRVGWFDKFWKRNELKNVTMLGESASAPKFLFSSNASLKFRKFFDLLF